jgi:hypothetical protein
MHDSLTGNEQEIRSHACVDSPCELLAIDVDL